MDTLIQELRYVLRGLARAPAFTLTAVLIIALGIAMNTTAFTIYDAVALRPLAVLEPRDLVRVVAPVNRSQGDLFPYDTYDFLARSAHSFSGVVATSAPQTLLAHAPGFFPDDIPVSARFVSLNYFPVLGVPVQIGRGLEPDRVTAVVSDAFWRAHLHASPDAIGATVVVNRISLTIAGVAPANFAGTGLPPVSPDLWLPATTQASVLPGSDWLRDRAQRQWQILARLAPKSSARAASAELAVLAPALAPADTESATLRAKAATLFQADAGEFETFGQLMTILMVAVGFILIIGAANLIGLVTARNGLRAREIAVRAALGASRWRIARLLFAESVALGLAGGSLGMLAALWFGDILRTWLDGTLAGLSGATAGVHLDLSLDWRIVTFTAGASILVGLAVGTWPTLRASRRDVHAALKGATGATDVRGSRGSVLVAAQLALSLVLLSAAGLLIRGANRASHIDPGFAADRALLVDFPPAALGATPGSRTETLRHLVDRIRSLAGVQSVAWTDRAPFAGHAFRTISTNASPVTFSVKAVSSDYFEALGIRLVSGRPFTSEEVTERRGVLIISESVAKRYWPGEDPVGRTVADHPWLERDDSQHSTIVGVVRDVRATYLSRIDNALYYPQALDARASLLIRTRGPAAAGSHSILAGLATLDPRLAAEAEVTPMDGGPLRGQRMMSTIPAALAAALALIGLLLAAVGLYGVVAQMVVRRTREIGVRVALGASRRQVTQMVLGRSLRPALWGTGAGFLGILGTSALFDAMLSAPDAPDLTYGRGTFDPVTFGLVLLVLGLTICLGSIGPARRALRVDPMVALRYE